jgi:hypothetical protein
MQGSSRALIVLLALLATVLAGCAERQSKEQYGENVKELYSLRTQQIAQLPTAATGDVQLYADSQEKLRVAANELDSIDPPKELQQAHDRHVEGLRGLSRVFGELADCARLEQREPQRSVECRHKIEREVLDEVENDLAEADTIYRHAGYEVGSDTD